MANGEPIGLLLALTQTSNITGTLLPPLLVDVDTIFAPSVIPGSVLLLPPLLDNQNSVFLPTIVGGAESELHSVTVSINRVSVNNRIPVRVIRGVSLEFEANFLNLAGAVITTLDLATLRVRQGRSAAQSYDLAFLGDVWNYEIATDDFSKGLVYWSIRGEKDGEIVVVDGVLNIVANLANFFSLDATPDAFSFVAETGAARSTSYTSSAITVSGITGPSAISIVGGTYSKNGGSFTSVAGTVVDGDTVAVKGNSSPSYSTAIDVVLTIGGVSGTYTITTMADPSISTAGVPTGLLLALTKAA